jgi:hypothetical protein
MTEQEISILFKIRRMTEIEQEILEIRDYIEYAKSKFENSITFNDDVDETVLNRLEKENNIKWKKKKIFCKKTIIFWDL